MRNPGVQLEDSWMNYESVCNILEKLMVEIMEKGIAVPQQTIDDLKSGRTMLNIYRTESAGLDSAMESEPYLQRAEMSLMILADSAIGKGYADEWQNRISRAYTELETDAHPTAKYITGVPKGESWIRIKTSGLMASGEVEGLLEQNRLSSITQKDGYLLVHGRKEDIASFLKAVRRKVGKTGP